MKIGVVVFPGSNCDHDAHYALNENVGVEAVYLFHKEHDLKDCDAILLPGGFSYGDYLRGGAIARFSPIMQEVVEFAGNGGVVVGICNGFQILCEAGLLPGALLRNAGLKFVCKYVDVRVETQDSRFTRDIPEGSVLNIPIAHGEGNYFADPDTLKELEENGRILFRYCEPDGSISEGSNPNGSMSNIAGIVNAEGNVMGMMPHPERACDPLLGSIDGLAIFRSLVASLTPVEA